MLIVALALLAVGLALGVGTWRRGPARRSVRVSVLTLAGVLTVLGLAATGTLVWARTATDTSQFARALVWGESAYGDQDRFPSRPIDAGGDVLTLDASDRDRLGDMVVDGRPLADVLADNQTTAFIVLRGTEILHESYANGSTADTVQTSFSVAKSFTAALVGIAIDEGVFDGLEDPITDHVTGLTDADPAFAEITLRHLLTMSSGLSFDDGDGPWDDPANTYHGTDLRRSAITTPRIEEEPGLTYLYNDWNVILLGLALEEASGMSVSEYASTRLWQPMGAEAAGSWSLDSESAGFEKMFVGVNGRARDFARFGLLFLQDGHRADDPDRQVVPSEFVAEATRVDTTTDPASHYQYLWWIDEDRGAYYANGDHGQFIYVDPDADVVIVRHGTGPGDVDWIPFLGDVTEFVAARGA